MVGRENVTGMTDHDETPMRAVGVHLMPLVGAPDPRRPSVVVELDAQGGIERMTMATTVAEIADAVRGAPALVAVDAPLAVPNEGGRRPVEDLLGWLDVNVFPSARGRLTSVYGGIRGEELDPALRAVGAEPVETAPDLVLRLLAWEAEGVRTDLGTFRARWLGLRPPTYRPKGAGRAKPAGLAPAAALLARVVDMGGWAPDPRDDWAAIRDAAILDAVACAHVAWRAVAGPADSTLRIDTGTVDMLLPCDPNLAERVQVNVTRMANEGARLDVRQGPAK